MLSAKSHQAHVTSTPSASGNLGGEILQVPQAVCSRAGVPFPCHATGMKHG